MDERFLDLCVHLAVDTLIDPGHHLTLVVDAQTGVRVHLQQHWLPIVQEQYVKAQDLQHFMVS